LTFFLDRLFGRTLLSLSLIRLASPIFGPSAGLCPFEPQRLSTLFVRMAPLRASHQRVTDCHVYQNGDIPPRLLLLSFLDVTDEPPSCMTCRTRPSFRLAFLTLGTPPRPSFATSCCAPFAVVRRHFHLKGLPAFFVHKRGGFFIFLQVPGSCRLRRTIGLRTPLRVSPPFFPYLIKPPSSGPHLTFPVSGRHGSRPTPRPHLVLFRPLFSPVFAPHLTGCSVLPCRHFVLFFFFPQEIRV